MKTSLKSIVFSLIVVFTVSTFTSEASELTVKIKNLDSWQEGILPSEFNELTVELKNSEQKVTSMQITLARGNRAVEIAQVKGNKFNLRKHISIARSGDRLVIEVTKQGGLVESSDTSNVVIVIKIN